MLYEFSWLNILYLLIVTHITILTVTIYLHRCVAHRALVMNKKLEHFFRFWSWLTTGQNTQEWAAVHRKHHAFCEKVGDPHSPQVFGIRTVLFKGMLLYRKEASNKETIERYGKNTPIDSFELFYSKNKHLGLVLMGIVNIGLFGLHGLWMYIIQLLWIPFWAAGVINGLGHYIGYRGFKTQDNSTNIFPFGLLIGGEELHNNHHAYPTSAKLSIKWYEFDIGWMWIKLFSLIGLVKINRVADVSVEKFKSISLQEFLSHKYFILHEFKKSTKNDVLIGIKKIKTFFPELTGISNKKLIDVFYNFSNKNNKTEEKIISLFKQNTMLCNVLSAKNDLEKIWIINFTSFNEYRGKFLEVKRNLLASEVAGIRGFANKLLTFNC